MEVTRGDEHLVESFDTDTVEAIVSLLQRFPSARLTHSKVSVGVPTSANGSEAVAAVRAMVRTSATLNAERAAPIDHL